MICSLGREARVVMIASGGETAAMLSTLPIGGTAVGGRKLVTVESDQAKAPVIDHRESQ